MSELRNKIKEHIKNKNIKVYNLVQTTGIDKSTLYQYLNGKRKINSIVLLKKIMSGLTLTVKEEEELIEYFHIQIMGRAAYFNRKNVERFIFTIQQRLHIPEKISTVENITLKEEMMKENCITVYGENNVEYMINQIISQECIKENAKIQVISQPTRKFLMGILTYQSRNKEDLSIEQVVCLDNEEKEKKASRENSNVVLFENIISTFIGKCDYQVYYYYDDVEAHFSSLNLMNCLVVTSSYVLSYTSDYKYGILYSNKEVIRQYQQIFEQYKSKTKTLFRKVDMGPEMIAELAPGEYRHQEMIYSLEPKPCIMPWITEELLRKYVKNLPERELVIDMLRQYFDTTRVYYVNNKMKCFFTKKGLESLALRCEYPQDVYNQYAEKIDRQDMKKILRNLYQELRAGNYHMLKGKFENLDEEIHLFSMSYKMNLMMKSNGEKQCYIGIYEPKLVQTFFEYFENIELEKYTYTIEEAERILDEVVGGELDLWNEE